MLVFLGIFLLTLTSGVWSVPCEEDCACSHSSEGKGKGHCDSVKKYVKSICGPHADLTKPAEPCRPSCDDPRPQNCSGNCEVGCKCDDNYILNSYHNECIPYDKCDQCKGDKNAKPSPCGSACPPRCDDPDPQVCTEQCIVNACVCNEGYMHLCHDGPCVRPHECPGGAPDCGTNRTYTNCKNITIDSYCPGTANNDNVNNGSNGRPGCVCAPGYKYNNPNDHQCIAEKDCPGCNGDLNKKHSPCANAPQPSCDNLNPNTTDNCTCQPGCVCNDGLVLCSADGHTCIKPEECQRCEGDVNAMGTNCKPNCEPTCESQVCPDTSCKIPCERACVCKPGYIRRCHGGPCIPKSECPY